MTQMGKQKKDQKGINSPLDYGKPSHNPKRKFTT